MSERTALGPIDPIDPIKGSGGCTPDKPIPSIPAHQRVTFELSYAGSLPVWLVTEGNYCSPIEISSTQGKGLMLAYPYQTICEGPPAPSPTVAAARRLSGRSQLTWDGRALLLYQSCHDCSPSWPMMGLVRHNNYVAQPVAAGSYRARFGILDEHSTECAEENGELRCWESGYDHGWGGYGMGACPVSRHVEVEFTLPATGDLVVPVVVPPRLQLAAPGSTLADRPARRPLGEI